MEKQGGTSEEDLEEIDEEMEMEVKEEEGTVGEEGGFFTQEAAGGVQIQIQSVGGMLMGMGMWPMRRCRPKEERTKLRERHRRAIKARILAGLQRHGKYNPRVRADINDVIAALAREEGWVVLPDGTTFPSSSQGGRAAAAAATPVSTMPSMAPAQTPPLRALSSSSSGSGLCRLKTVSTPPAVMSYGCRSGSDNCMDVADEKPVTHISSYPIASFSVLKLTSL